MAQKYSDIIGSRHLKLINFIGQYLEVYFFKNLNHKKKREKELFLKMLCTKPGR